MDIYSKEDEYWQHGGSLKWVLFGDANTTYFQAIANDQHRRCTIPVLWDGARMIQEPEELRSHLDGFYKDLFAGRPRGGISLVDSIWSVEQQVSRSGNDALLAPFEEAKVEVLIKSMNPDSTPHPDSLLVRFF
ncbi:putative NOT transcription complex subunit VIP2 [Hordeum vulgare]|nr:putative NOT transcription complex subunit VIP2 [Hordeum vulgare]